MKHSAISMVQILQPSLILHIIALIGWFEPAPAYHLCRLHVNQQDFEAGPILLSKNSLSRIKLSTSSKVLSFIRVGPQHAWILKISYPIVGSKPKIFHSSLLVQVRFLGEKHPEESLGLWSRRKEKHILVAVRPHPPQVPRRDPTHSTHLSQA